MATTELFSILTQYLNARHNLDVADRSVSPESDVGDWEDRCVALSDKFDEAVAALRAAVLVQLGLDPRYSTPRPVAAMIRGFVVMVVPDPYESMHPEKDGRLAMFGWRKRDILDVARRSDVFVDPDPAPAKPKPRRKAKGGAL